MRSHLSTAADVVLGRSPEEWIGALVVALLLALTMAGVYKACRRKLADSAMLLVVLGMVANVAGMVIAAGYVRPSPRRTAGPPGAPEARGAPDRLADSLIEGMAFRVLVAADADHNGRLSPDEAAAAADRFIKGVDAEGHGPVDFRALGAALKQRVKPPGLTGTHAPPAPAGAGN